MRTDPNRLTFEIVATDDRARAGVLRTPHGEVETPCFVPLATRGSVKGLLPDEVAEIGYEMVLGNTYHLMLAPGSERIASLGAGQNAQLKIRAKANAPGNHIFRVEVRSDVGSRLVREGTTRFYGEPGSRAVAQPAGGQSGPAPSQPGQPGQSQPGAGTDRTAVRPDSTRVNAAGSIPFRITVIRRSSMPWRTSSLRMSLETAMTRGNRVSNRLPAG